MLARLIELGSALGFTLVSINKAMPVRIVPHRHRFGKRF